MTPLRYYQKSFTRIGMANPAKESKTQWAKTELPEHFFNKKYLMSYMNDLVIPSENLIIQLQILNIRWNYPYDEALTATMNGLSEETFHLGELGSMDFSVNDMLEIIEAIFTTTFQDSDGTMSREYIDALSTRLTAKNFERDHAHYQKALDRLKAVYDMFSLNQDFINEAAMKEALGQLEAAITLLSQDLAQGGASEYGYKRGYFGFDKSGKFLQKDNKVVDSWRNKKNKNGKAWEYDKTIIGYGNTLKGRWFEKMVIEFLKKKVIDPQQGIIDTANIKGPVFNILGQVTDTKTFRTDALMFNLNSTIKITYYYNDQKKTADLKTFMEDCNRANASSNTTITLPAGEWERLVGSGAVAGVQAKSGKNQSIINNYSISARDAFALAGGEWAHMFNHMIQWYSCGHIYATHDDYDAVFNYGISHALQYIIGIGNNYLALRNRIVPTAVYLEEQIAQSRYIRARRKVDFNNPDNEIPVDLSSSSAVVRNV